MQASQITSLMAQQQVAATVCHSQAREASCNDIKAFEEELRSLLDVHGQGVQGPILTWESQARRPYTNVRFALCKGLFYFGKKKAIYNMHAYLMDPHIGWQPSCP